MARDFSKPFYNSAVWKKTREYIMKRDGYMCQCNECNGGGLPAEEVHHKKRLTPENINDVSVTLNEGNLIAVARDCHFRIHEQDKLVGAQRNDCEKGMYFDDNGVLRVTS